MEMYCQNWKPGTQDFVPHHVLGDYLQDAASENLIMDVVELNTRVNHIQKVGTQWEIQSTKWSSGVQEQPVRVSFAVSA